MFLIVSSKFIVVLISSIADKNRNCGPYQLYIYIYYDTQNGFEKCTNAYKTSGRIGTQNRSIFEQLE